MVNSIKVSLIKIFNMQSLFHLGNTSLDNKKFREIIEKEIFARKVDGLMSVYLGPSKYQILRIDQEDIRFFSRFYYKDQLMFEKALEKNTIALKLKQKGMPWQEIQDKLEFAEKYKYEGKLYDWPENKANIPAKNFLDRRKP